MIENSSKYKLIVNDVTSGIQAGIYKRGSRIPSINEFMYKFKLSRDTVFTGLSELKSKGIIDSKPGLGYFIASTRVSRQQKIFLLFNEFNAFKEELFSSFIQAIGKSVTVDLFFHNYNRSVFNTLISEANGKYTTYIIMSGKFKGLKPTLAGLNGQVYLLDHFHPELYGKYGAVYQNFENDTYEGLAFAADRIKKYSRIIMVQRDEKEPYERYNGLEKFSKEFNYTCEYIPSITNRPIAKGELYLVVNDMDIVELVKKAEKKKWTLGKEIGIISYNETPIKEVVSGGITTLSTDFTIMGETMSGLLNEKAIRMVENPWKLTFRRSL